MTDIIVTMAAIDDASNRCRGVWLDTRIRPDHGEGEGLFTWLRRMTHEALWRGEKLPSGKIRYGKLKLTMEILANPDQIYVRAVERVRE